MAHEPGGGRIYQLQRRAGSFTLPDEQAMALADEKSPVFLHGAFDIIQSMFRDLGKFEQMFRSGRGMGWGEHDGCLFTGTARFFRPNYAGNVVSNWIPALEGVRPKLERGAVVADVGCGYGYSTMLMAQAFPKSKFVGFDSHAPSIATATKMAASEGLSNCRFETASAQDFSGANYDLVACFDCLHDMADPVGAAIRVKRALAPDGVWMIVEPFANDAPQENLNPVGRVFLRRLNADLRAGIAIRQRPGPWRKAGEKRLGDVVRQGGFTRFRRATQTAFNLVLEARP